MPEYCIRFLLELTVGIPIRLLPELMNGRFDRFVAYGILRKHKLVDVRFGNLVLSKKGQQYLTKLKKVKP